jgi:hypothetical protein
METWSAILRAESVRCLEDSATMTDATVFTRRRFVDRQAVRVISSDGIERRYTIRPYELLE